MRWLLVAIVAFVAACAKKVEELSPFPCPASKQCPSGLACIEDECVKPVIDGFCELGDRNVCDLLGVSCVVGDVRKSRGTCQQACNDDTECGGRICSGGACLLDCAADPASCPSDTECRTRSDGRNVCAPRGAPSLGDECIVDADCALLTPDAVCAHGATGAYGRCAVRCTGDDSCHPTEKCLSIQRGNFLVSTCAKRCDATTACSDGFSCVDGGCAGAQRAKDGERCTTTIQCEPTLTPAGVSPPLQQYCRPVDGVARCTPECRRGVACPAGLSCNQPDGATTSYYCEPKDPETASCSIASPSLLGLVGLGFLLFPRRRRPRQSRGA